MLVHMILIVYYFMESFIYIRLISIYFQLTFHTRHNRKYNDIQNEPPTNFPYIAGINCT